MKSERKIGLIITEDGEHWGGEKGIGDFIKERFVSNDNGGIKYELIFAVNSILPEQPEGFTGFVISGSHHSVNDEKPWMKRLESFILDLENIPIDVRPKVFGICFGHQLIAKAYGGTIEQNENKKFFFGSEKIHIKEELLNTEFMKNTFGVGRETFQIMQSHGEEVGVIPSNAINMGYSSTCCHEILKYGDHILTTQGHPELIETKMKEIMMPRLIMNKKLVNKEIEIALNSIAIGETDVLIKLVLNFLTTD